jgi:peptide/nickel transport system permease protein
VLAAAWLIAITVVAIFGPVVYAASYEAIDVTSQYASPGPKYLLGADENGRDVLARLMFGGRISLVVGTVAAAVGIVLGTAVGAVAGQFGGRVDAALMRTTDTFMSLPTFFFLLMLLALFGGGIHVLVLGIGFTSWEGVARVVRSEVLRHKGMEFVQAARAIGATELRLMVRHLLPQAIPSIIVASMLGIAHAILAEAALSYLGLGVRVPLPSWGNMLSGAQNYLFIAPQLAIWPGLLIMLTVLALNIFGDGLRDVLDPQLAGERD